MSLLSELKRRNVFRVAALYAVASWVLLQVGDLLFDALSVPDWGLRLLLGMLLLGFVPALIFAWIYELTPEGLRREHEVAPDASITAHTARKLDLTVIVLLVAAIGLVAADRLLNHRAAAPAPSAGAPAAPGAVAAVADGAALAVSIAVLPFVNMSDDRENEYFSDGLTEELLNVLANVQGMRVIARTSSFAYKGKDVKIADVARELNVDNVLEGSVRKSGDKVRITTQLIRASDSSHMWSQTYDRNLDDVFALQDEISGEVVEALKLRLLQGTSTNREVGSTQVPDAYDAYLRGRFLRNQGYAEDTLRKALAAFDEAIRLDPKYARAHVGRSEILVRLGSNGYLPFDTAFEQARRAAQQAMALAPDLAESYVALSITLGFVERDQKASLEAAERALALNPGSLDVQGNYSQLASSIGRRDEAIASGLAAAELDPLSPEAHIGLASTYYFAGRFAEAEQAARRAIALAPDHTSSHYTLGMVLLSQRQDADALAEFEKESVRWQRMTGRALVFARTGRVNEARKEMDELHRQLGDAPSYQLAQISAQLGDVDGAFRWLENARRVHDPGLVGQLAVDPLLDGIRQDPRYDRLMQQTGLAAVVND